MVDRGTPEIQALLEVCTCQYCNLADSISTETDATPLAIANHTTKRELCSR